MDFLNNGSLAFGLWNWKGKVGKGEMEGKAWGGVAAGKGKSDLGLWEGEGEKGKAGGGGKVGGWKRRK